MTHARGQRSKESYDRRLNEYEVWLKWKAEEDRARRIVLDYSYRDIENREVVFTKDFWPIVEKKLKAKYHGGVPMHAINDLEFGDVLNRFPLRVQQRTMKYYGWLVGGFQQ